MDLLVESHYEQQLEEGWKENIMAAVITAASMFGGVKGQTKADIKPGIEQSVQDTLNIDFRTAFPSGRYLMGGPSQDILTTKLKEIGKHITKNPSADYKIEIISSESQVPNYDAEKPGRVKLNRGELAQKRATVLNVAIKEFTDDLKQDGVLQGNVSIETAPILIGKEKFNPGVDDKDDAKYTKDQFVKLRITAIPKKVDKYAKYSNSGERIFMGNKAYAMVFYPTSITIDRSKEGGLSTPYQNILLKTIDLKGLEMAGKSINPNINASNQYIATYEIPWDEWNKTAGSTNHVTQDMMDSWEKYKTSD